MCIVKWQSAESTWTGGWNHLHINIALQIKATVHPRRQIRASLRKSSDVRNRRITRNVHRRLAISTSDPRSDRGIISRNTKHHPMQPCYSHRCNRSERNAFNEGCNRQITFPPEIPDFSRIHTIGTFMSAMVFISCGHGVVIASGIPYSCCGEGRGSVKSVGISEGAPAFASAPIFCSLVRQ